MGRTTADMKRLWESDEDVNDQTFIDGWDEPDFVIAITCSATPGLLNIGHLDKSRKGSSSSFHLTAEQCIRVMKALDKFVNGEV